MHLAAKRAREINNYYHALGEGLGHYTPPLVESSSNKPLSIALEEIAEEKIVVQHPGDAQRVAEELLSATTDDEGAEVVALDPDVFEQAVVDDPAAQGLPTDFGTETGAVADEVADEVAEEIADEVADNEDVDADE